MKGRSGINFTLIGSSQCETFKGLSVLLDEGDLCFCCINLQPESVGKLGKKLSKLCWLCDICFITGTPLLTLPL